MARKYKFNRPSDRIVTTTAAVTSVAALGAGLSLAFNPVAVGVAGGLGLINYFASNLMMIPAYKNRLIKSQVKKGKWEAVPADAPAVRITAEISEQLGRKKAPGVYTVDSKTVAKFALPFGMRWLLKIEEVQDQAMKSLFGAIPGANTIITTKQALDNGLTEEQLRFIAAHEMSHLHTKDNISPNAVARAIIKKTTRTLFWTSLVAAGAGLAGVALPIFATAGLAGMGLAAAAWGGSYLTARVINNFAGRAVEQRADRNGIYITRDLENAKGALAKIDPTSENAPRPVKDYMKDMMVDHPMYNRRIKIMTKAFNKISKLPLLPAPAQKAAPQPPQQQSAPTV